MRKWRCTVCNYIHEGEALPEKCPVCGADKSKFVEVSDQEAEEIQAAKTEKQLERERAMEQKVNGRAGSGREASQAGGASGRQKSKSASGWVEFANEQMIRHHAHPMSVHIPNGVLPVSVLFVLLAILFSAETLATAAFYNSIIVLVSMPAVLYSGYNAWQHKFGGNLSPLFTAKITAAAVVAVTCLLVVLWHLFDPEIMGGGAARQGGFVLLNLVMLVAAVVAGLIGGKLVFKD